MNDKAAFADPIPIFPLPNVVLMPGEVIPVQIYEPRYRAMARDALDGPHLIAMALLKPGFEATYYGNDAEIYPVVCVSRIHEHIRIPDGRYFLNLGGVCPAKVQYEDTNGSYRSALLEPIWRENGGIDADGQYAARQSLTRVVETEVFEPYGNRQDIEQVLHSTASLDEVIDHIAAQLLPEEAIDIKQHLLSETDALQRAEILLNELHMLQQLLESRANVQNDWPRLGSDN